MDPVEKARKSKKKKPRMDTMPQHEEMDLSQPSQEPAATPPMQPPPPNHPPSE
ncbi:hypothetical protein PIB30_025434 [Stylosanthes scabra]|uniref:Uncharacterized protein n=1 Tax=Stylosanthes scabra TaxID=79078 RepID=A0ABU6T9Q4_9FABA|nr:hypothetical protein [Stylosanthes scabra]